MLGPKHTLADGVVILEEGLNDGSITLDATDEKAQPDEPDDLTGLRELRPPNQAL